MFKLPISIKEEIKDYKTAIKDFIDGRSSWARFAGIRVPWGNYSHRGGKVFMSRVRIPAGVLGAEQLKALTHCAREYGNGLLHITTRQDIQIHEVKVENIIKIHEYLKDYELSSRGGGGNTVRNVTSCPLSGVCKKEIFDVQEDAVSLTEYLLSEETSYNLPRKFKIAFSGCGVDCAASAVNDVGLIAVDKNGELGYRVYAGGGMGAKSSLGKLLEEFIPREDLGFVITAVKGVFYKYGDRRNKHHNRLRFLIGDIGFEKFKDYYKKELEDLRKSEYIALREVHFSYPKVVKDNAPKIIKEENFDRFLKYNCEGQKQEGFVFVKLRIPRGDLDCEKAARLADLKDDFKTIEFRTSKEQDIFICNIRKTDLYNFYIKIKKIDEEFLYAQTLLDVVACKGSLTCNLGLCNSPALAKEVEDLVKKNFIETNIFDKLDIKINGCPNSCGHHPIGAISFHGVARKVLGRAVPFYRLFLGGRVGGAQTQLAKDTGLLIPAKNVPLFLKDLLARIDNEIDENTDIYAFLDKRGEVLARELSKMYLFVPAYSENRDFYIDWGRTEDFSLEGLGPGECGAGILDMIEADLSDARITLEAAEKENWPVLKIRRALFLGSRALLVVKGSDPKTEEEALSNFVKKFVNEKIASDKYSDIKIVFDSLNDNLKPEERTEKGLYAKEFIAHINQLYKSMDSSFNFPKEEKEIRREPATVLDLKGTPCPTNYVKAKLFLENLNEGDVLEIFLDEGEPIRNVPRSLKDDGNQILKIESFDGYYKVVVKKGNK